MTARILLALLFLLPGLAGAVDDYGDQYRNAVGSVVWVTTYDSDWKPYYGTGVVVEGGDILTAYHVIAGGLVVVAFPEFDAAGDLIADSEYYTAGKGRLLPCKVIHRDMGRDLALLRLVTPRPASKPIPLAAKSPAAGQSIFTIGNSCHPGVLFRFASGSVRQVYAYSPKEADAPVSFKQIMMSIPLNGGDSGGPVIRNGELVGMSTSSDGESNQIHYAVDITEIRAFLENTVEKKWASDPRK